MKHVNATAVRLNGSFQGKKALRTGTRVVLVRVHALVNT